MSAASAVDESSWDSEDALPQGGGGGLLEVVPGQTSHAPAEDVGHHGQREPGGVGHELPRGQVRESGALVSSAIRCSTTAWRRWSASTRTTSPGRLVTKAW